jgi:hypothetical protein
VKQETDPYAAYVISLLLFDELHGADIPWDYPRGAAWIKTGSPLIIQGDSPVSNGGCIALEGATNLWLTNTAGSNTLFNMGTGDFCQEFWAKHNGVGRGFDTHYVNIPNRIVYRNGGTNPSFTELKQFSVPAFSIQSLAASDVNTWFHLAQVRDSSNITLYVNGVAQATYAFGAGAIDDGTVPQIGRGTSGIWSSATTSLRIAGYRVTKGHKRYSGNFTPPTYLPIP